MKNTLTCLRCGDFVTAENAVVAGVGVCRACHARGLEGERLRDVAHRLSRRSYRRTIVIFAVTGFVVAGVLSAIAFQHGLTFLPGKLASAPPPVVLVFESGAGALLGELLALLVLLVQTALRGQAGVRLAPLAAHVGFDSVPPERLRVVSVKRAKVRRELALLVEDQGGLVLVGTREAPRGAALAEIRLVRALRPRLVPWVAFCVIYLRAGGFFLLRCQAGSVAERNRATEALASRIAALVAKSSKNPPSS